MKTNDRISTFISLVLRHNPKAAGIRLDDNGWAGVEDLLLGVSKNYALLTMETLEVIVAMDTKQRYTFNEDKTKIRANQGHSIKVDVELVETAPPAILYHGTAEKSLDSIMKTGLSGRTRQYVHLSDNKGTALAVGTRHGAPVILEVDAKKMAKDGHPFFLSKNGVWLCRFVPVEYLKITK